MGACAKYTLVVLNLIIWLVGVVVLVAGIFAYFPQYLSVFGDFIEDIPPEVFTAFDSTSKSVGLSLMIAGGCLFVIGFLGCCGALKGITLMLTLYASILIVLILLQITAGIIFIVMKDRVFDEMGKLLLPLVHDEFAANETSTDPATLGMNAMQKGMKCCGVYNSTDWDQSDWKAASSQPGVIVVPATCCVFEGNLPKNYLQCQQNAQTYLTGGVPDPNTDLHHNGCLTTMLQFIEDNKVVAIIVSVLIILLQVAAVSMACTVRKESMQKD